MQTGDKLYDSYGRLLLEEMGNAEWNAAPACWLTDDTLGMAQWRPRQQPGFIQRLLRKSPATQQPDLIDCHQVLEWESSYSSDPRYWELRAVCLDTWGEPGGVDRLKLDLYHLEQLCSEGKGDEGAYELLARHAGRLIDESHGEIVEDYMLKVCEQAIRQYPDNSYWYYLKARILIDLGEADEAWATLEAGNDAPRNEWPQPYPLSTLFDQRYSTCAREGNQVVRGVLAIQFSDHLPNFIRIKESYKNACVMLALGYAPAFGDEMLKMAGRIGQMTQTDSLYQKVAAVCVSVLGDYVRTDLLGEPQASNVELRKLADFSAHYSAVAGEPAPNFPPYTRTDKEPATAFQAALLAGDEALKTADPDRGFAGAYRDLPALVKSDWLAFDRDFQADLTKHNTNAELFAALVNPPLARLLKAAAHPQN